MALANLDALRYPIGPYQANAKPDDAQFQSWLRTIALFPDLLENAVHGLSNEALDTPYRPEGWSIRQVVHHCADSHMNALMRYKLALTEDNPTIRPYLEDRWAKLPDSLSFPIESSLQIVRGVHHRWNQVLSEMSTTDFKRSYFHPEHQRSFELIEVLGLYAWHCRHHLAHIENARASYKQQ